MKEAFIRLHVLLCAFSAQRKANKSPEMRKKGRREEGSFVGVESKGSLHAFSFPGAKGMKAEPEAQTTDLRAQPSLIESAFR